MCGGCLVVIARMVWRYLRLRPHSMFRTWLVPRTGYLSISKALEPANVLRDVHVVLDEVAELGLRIRIN